MGLVVIAVAIFAALVALWVASRAAVTICVAEIHQGKLVIRRGSLPPRLRDDLADVIRKPLVRHGHLRVLRDRDHARIECSGDLSDAQRQRLRNVVGTVPLARLTAGRR
jgi:hypothetical protein